MSVLPSVTRAAGLSAILALALTLAACAYDYRQHTDRVAYSAGDAVKANLASETTNPSKRSMYATGGLGKNGNVIPAAPAN
jgi:hypothetical protein